MHVQIATKLEWPSFRNTATSIRKALAAQCACTIRDSNAVKPGGNIIFIGTLDKQTLLSIKKLIPESKVVFYATTEGLSRLDDADRQTAARVRIVAVSDFVKEMLKEIGISVAGVVHHGVAMNDRNVNTQFYQKMKARFKDRKIILTVSANHPRKGLDNLLDAYKIVERQIPEVFLILHSERNGYYDLETRAANLGIKRLWLTNKFGKITQTKLNSLYRLCTLYVQPSLSEGFGLPILEAFRFDKPAVAVDAPPFNEIIANKSTGLLVPLKGVSFANFENSIDFQIHEYRPKDLASAIEYLMRGPQFLAKLRQQVAKQKWNWDTKLYRSLLTYFD